MSNIQKYNKNEIARINPDNAIKGIIIREHKDQEAIYNTIAKQVSRMLALLGNDVNDNIVESFTDFFLEKYEYETPETLILFIRKAGNGDFGKPYGRLDTGTLSEWWAKYYEDYISPAFERANSVSNEKYERLSSSTGIGSVMKRLGNNGYNRK